MRYNVRLIIIIIIILIDIVTTERLRFFGYLSFEFLETDGAKHKFVYLLTFVSRSLAFCETWHFVVGLTFHGT